MTLQCQAPHIQSPRYRHRQGLRSTCQNIYTQEYGGIKHSAENGPYQTPQSPSEASSYQSAPCLLFVFSDILQPFHPAMSFPDLTSTFGPLIFVLYRAALCRKRILFLAPVPVERTCHFGTRP